MASRKIEDLHPDLVPYYWEWDAEMKKAGLDFIVTSTARTIVEQMALFVQGRMDLVSVNRMRFIADLPTIKEHENKAVTWTLQSLHVTNMFDDKLNNDFAWAWDFALVDPSTGLPHWVLKVDVNKNQLPDYKEAGELAKKLGLEYGGDWGDACHIQRRSV